MLDSPTALQRILVVDDEENVRHMLKLVLTRAGYGVETASGVDEALALAAEQPFHVVLTDLRMPKRSGLELLAEFSEKYPQIYVILMTAYGSVDTAVEAMGQGAYDYISKPFKPGEVLLTLRKVEEREGLVQENRRLREAVAASTGLDGLIGTSPHMLDCARLARRFAPHKTTVLITGESGTGKELFARAIHGLSDRQAGPFVAVNCAAIPENLLESELLAIKRGRSPGPRRIKRGSLKRPTGAPSFSMNLGKFPWASRQNYCGPWPPM